MVTIYALKEPDTGKIRYIGQTSNLKKRLASHLNDRIRCYRTNWINSLRARGLKPDSEVLLLVPEEQRNEWEIKFISVARSQGFDLVNQTVGGEAPMLGKKHSPETRAKLAAVHTGRKHTDETLARMSAAHKGKKFSEEHCRNLGLSHLGIKCPEEKKIKQSLEWAGEGNPYAGKFGADHPAFGTKRENASSPFSGVSWDKSRKKWRVVVAVSGKHTYVGRFNTEQDAREAAEKALEEIK